MNATNFQKYDTAKRLKAIFTGSIGNLVEWYGAPQQGTFYPADLLANADLRVYATVVRDAK